MAGQLTDKNRLAIDLYLSGKDPFAGNGTACWQEVYRTRNKATAAANWARMLRNASAQAYLHTRQAEIEEARRVHIAFDRDRYMATLEELLRVTSAQYVGDDGRRHIEDAARARQIAKDLYAAETNNVFPFQQDTGLRVNISINTQYQGEQQGANVVSSQGAQDNEPVEPPRAIAIPVSNGSLAGEK